MPRNKEDETFPFKKLFTIVVIVIIAVAGVLTAANMFRTVPAGYQGVLLNWGKPIDNLSPGLHTILPIGQDIQFVNTQTQSAEATESAATLDLQEVTTSITVNYHIDPAFAEYVYTNLRDEYASRVIIPAMQDGLKATTAKYQATELITLREDTKNKFQLILQEKLIQYHIIIDSVMMTNFQFSESFTAAIEAKVTAEQNALAAQNQLAVIQFQAQQQVIQAQAAANATVTTANAEAMKTVITANATAEAIKVVNVQIANSPDYLRYMQIMSWNGQLPTYWGGSAPIPFLNVDNNSTAITP